MLACLQLVQDPHVRTRSKSSVLERNFWRVHCPTAWSATRVVWKKLKNVYASKWLLQLFLMKISFVQFSCYFVFSLCVRALVFIAYWILAPLFCERSGSCKEINTRTPLSCREVLSQTWYHHALRFLMSFVTSCTLLHFYHFLPFIQF